MPANYQVKPPAGPGRFDLPEFLPSIIGIVFIALWALSIGDAYDWGHYKLLAQVAAVPAATAAASFLTFFSGWGVRPLAAGMVLCMTLLASWAAYRISGGFLLPILTFLFVLGDQVRVKRQALLKRRAAGQG